MEKTTFELIYDVVKKIPKGTVATYGQVKWRLWQAINAGQGWWGMPFM